MAHCNQRVRFAATWREKFFEVPFNEIARDWIVKETRKIEAKFCKTFAPKAEITTIPVLCHKMMVGTWIQFKRSWRQLFREATDFN
jgi:hypothetical protein